MKVPIVFFVMSVMLGGVEFLVNVGKIPTNAYFLFAAVKIRDCHGGPGRAMVLYD